MKHFQQSPHNTYLKSTRNCISPHFGHMNQVHVCSCSVSQSRPSHVKTERPGDICIPAFVTIPPKSGHDQSDHRTSNHVHFQNIKTFVCIHFKHTMFTLAMAACIKEAVSTLGYTSLKPEQEKVVFRRKRCVPPHWIWKESWLRCATPGL